MTKVLFMPVLILLLGGCDTEDEREALPDWSAGYDDTEGTILESDDDTDIIQGHTSDLPDGFGLGIPWDVSWPVRLRKANTLDAPCVAGGRYPREVRCVMEMNELDLNVLGLTYEILAPRGMCEFVKYKSYMFENWQVGEGPSDVSWLLDPTDPAHPIRNEENSIGGAPYCEFDYSEIDGPNCCLGKYQQTVVNVQTGDVQTSLGEWGGNAADCYAGAAYLDGEAEFSDDGWPISTIIFTDRNAFVKRVDYEGLSKKWGSNVLLANYWDPVDHANDLPAALKGIAAQPYYEFACLDDADEIIARITMSVREWNEEAQFDIDGNPDTIGTESLWGTPLDDISDWATITPDNTSFPMLYE